MSTAASVRLAIRDHGEHILFYLAQVDTMEDAELLAALNAGPIKSDEQLWEDVKKAYSDWLARTVEKHTGVKPESSEWPADDEQEETEG